MPGYRRPLTTAFEPTELRGFNALEKAFAAYRPLNHGSLRRKSSIEARRQSVPATFVNLPSSDEDQSSAESASESRETQKSTPAHEPSHFGLRPARRLVTPPHLTREHSGLPPTPPTMANSDENEPRMENLATNVQFADAVRDGLQKRKSGISTPAGHLPTPDPSPPGTTEDLTSPTFQPMLLHPLSAHHLRQYPSSRAESFHTAREDPSRSQNHLPNTPSPQPQPSMQNWLDSTRDTRFAKIGFTQPIDERSKVSPPIPEYTSLPRRTMPPYVYATPTYSRRAKRAASPYRTPESDLDLEKHISYINNEDEAEPYFLQQDDAELDALVASSWLNNGSPMEEEASAEDVNNLVYKQIQEENAKRHSLISNGSAVAAGIYFADPPVREHKLKRTARHESLRHFSSASDNSRRNSVDIMPKPLRLRKAQQPVRSLEASPVVETSPRAQRILPMSREPDSPMARLTRAAMTGESEPVHEIKRAHTLRHASKTKRLETSIPSRRTSAESGDTRAPMTLDSTPVLSSPTRKLRHSSRETQLDNAASIRRTSPPHIPPYLSRELHPGMEPERTLRHFSNETKLENNSRVRRTSLEMRGGAAAASPLKRGSWEGGGGVVPAPPRKNSWDVNGGFVPASPRKNSWDVNGGFVASSPRKNSLDARLLHPITTPMSTSQLSDQTAVEVCEATGINIYPHNNHSLLVVQHGAREDKPDNYLGLTNQHLGIGMPLFSAHVQEPTPTTPRMANPTIHVDSPLTNPRAAPIPPALQVIPPTPCSELDRQLTTDEEEESPVKRPGAPQRRQSLIQRARRFSESFIEQPLFGRSASLRKPTKREPANIETRPSTLSPLWQPRRFWDGYDSEDDDYDDDEMENYEDLDGRSGRRLPAGGDTSSIESHRQRRRRLLPRSMSVRMPGFRGAGGQAGSLLGDRRRTQQQQQVVVRKRSSSAGGLHTGGAHAYISQGSLRQRTSEEMLRQMVGGKGMFTLPFSGGRRVQYVGVGKFRERMGQLKFEREEREREKKRQGLREAIVHKGV
ncbi:hypothetical protein B0A55_02538 [Friedmanniomyces simplex]|uniref:Uncharacterized protein n=1 Tax=Friedmanniomyces simplex TaxID=329884 RepID=A0A4U0XTQ1_9PEZI|nr:hypothetical protein B0A55_02538 [Friedmanniomyces simplex]